MLSHCANSQCGKPFLRLGQGKLFLVEAERSTDGEWKTPLSPRKRPQPQRVERFWLCDQCSEIWTLAHDRSHGIMLLPLPPPVGTAVRLTQAYPQSA
jgi:hypothetical protein